MAYRHRRARTIMQRARYHAAMTPEQDPVAVPSRHAMTYRPNQDRYEWLRRAAFDRRTTMQSIIDQALDQLRLPSAQDQGLQDRDVAAGPWKTWPNDPPAESHQEKIK